MRLDGDADPEPAEGMTSCEECCWPLAADMTGARVKLMYRVFDVGSFESCLPRVTVADGMVADTCATKLTDAEGLVLLDAFAPATLSA